MTHVATRWIPTLVVGLFLWSFDLTAASALLGAGHNECGSCHFSGQTGTRGARPDAETCVTCHDPASMQTVPLAGGDAWPAHYRPASSLVGPMDCLTCHDPHAEDSDGRIREIAPLTNLDAALDRQSRLCVQCHDDHAASGEMAYTRHPVGIPVPGGLRLSADPSAAPLVDVAGTDDPADDVIACKTCHTIHERRERHLLRWRGREGMIAGCTSCHDLSGASGRGNRWVSARP